MVFNLFHVTRVTEVPTYVSGNVGAQYQPDGSQEASSLLEWASFDKLLRNGS